MGEWMKISLMILMKQLETFDELIEFYRKHGGGFVEDNLLHSESLR
jgi:hypothetical protein